MKKININIFVFVIVMLFILAGFTLTGLGSIKDAAVGLLKDIKNLDGNWMPHLTQKIDHATNQELRYHDFLVDVHSARLNVMNFDLIEKEKVIVVKTEDEYLYEEYWYYKDEEISTAVTKIGELQQVAEDNGAKFLYVASPTKGYGVEYPDNANNYETDNIDRYMAALNEAGIPNVNLMELMEQEGLLKPESYFVTDHHWKPELGFWASGKICQALNEKYGFAYNQAYTDLQNYNVKVYEDWFLGSYGKQTGCYYSDLGLDDISLITPKFETDLTEQQPFKNLVRTGSFEDSALHMENLEQRDPHNLNPYATYSGGDFRLQILRNNLNPDGGKILIIRDSTASVVTPFLALNAGELHVVDVRDGDSYVGEKLNVYDYIEEIDPDYVMVLYGGAISEVWGRLNFE